MNSIDEIRTRLIEFRDCDKFKVYADLQPAVVNSTEADKKFVNDEVNACCNELLQYVQTSKPLDGNLKKIVRSSVDRIEDAGIDTEDREFCYELYFQIGEILGIDIEDKSKSMEQKLLENLHRIIKKGGLNPDDFLPNDSKLK